MADKIKADQIQERDIAHTHTAAEISDGQISVKGNFDRFCLVKNEKTGKFSFKLLLKNDTVPLEMPDGSVVDWPIAGQAALNIPLMSQEQFLDTLIKQQDIDRQNQARIAENKPVKMSPSQARRNRRKLAAYKVAEAREAERNSYGDLFEGFNLNEALSARLGEMADDKDQRKLEQKISLLDKVRAGAEVSLAACETWLTAAIIRRGQTERMKLPEATISTLPEGMTAEMCVAVMLATIDEEIDLVKAYFEAKKAKGGKKGSKLVKQTPAEPQQAVEAVPAEVAA